MESTPPSNVERLQDAGFTIKTPLPPEYESAIEGASEAEIEALISVKRRLDEAQVSTAAEVGPYTQFFVPF